MLAVGNNTAVNVAVQRCLQEPDFISFNKYPEVGLPDHMVADF